MRYKPVINSSPYVKYHGIAPSVDHLKVIGTFAYVHIPVELQKKFGAKSRKMRLVNYTDSNKLMRFWLPSTKTIQSFHDFSFLDEDQSKTKLNRSKSKITESKDNRDYETVEIEIEHNAHEQITNDKYPLASDSINSTSNDDDDTDDEPPDKRDLTTEDHLGMNSDLQEDQPAQTKQTRKRKVYERVERNLRPRLLSVIKPNHDIWKQAELEEVNSLVKLNTWTLGYPPPNTKIIKCGFIHGIKLDPISGELKFKARCCAKGYQQMFGIDYLDTYAPTMSIVSVKILLVIAVNLNLFTKQFDVTSAFLNSTLKEEIWMDQPIDDGSGLKCRLNKSIYGLKQSAYNWHDEFSSSLIKYGFMQSNSDKCLFIFATDNQYMLLGIYVDDGLIFSSCEQLIVDLLSHFQNLYTIKSGDINKFIGLEIEKRDNSIYMHQHSYIDKLIKYFDPKLTRTVSTPLSSNFKINKDLDCDESIGNRSLTCSLLFLLRLSRPDIAYSVGILSSKLSKPSLSDLLCGVRVLKYVAFTKNYKMIIRKADQFSLDGYADANFNVEEKGLSRTGCIIYFMSNPIAWFSRLQSIPAKSTAEAEWYAVDSCLREMLWIRTLIEELKFRVNYINIYSDNLSTIKICNTLNQTPSLRTKHVERTYYYIHYYIKNNTAKLIYIPTQDQPADVLTKSLSKTKLDHLTKYFLKSSD